MASIPLTGTVPDVLSPADAAEDSSVRTTTAAERLTARLDRLPMTRSMWIMAILLTFGGFFDGYAIGLIGALGPGLMRSGIFTATTVSFFGMSGFASFVAALFAGLFIASLLVSYVADRFGRRAVFAFSLLWFGIANFMMGMQTTADGVNLWRFVSALGVGVELVTVDAYLSELIPKRNRGQAFAFLQAMSAISGLVAYFLAWQLIPKAPFGYDGWRWVACIGSIAAVAVWWIRLRLPESPRWLAQQGRLDEAEKVMLGIETRAQAEFGRPLPTPEQPHYQDPRKGSIAEIFSSRYRKRTIMLMLFNFFQTVGFYGFVGWTPTLLIAKGIHVTQSLEYSLIINIAAVAFPLLIMLFADRLERKWHACIACTAIAAFGMMFGSATSTTAVIVLGACLAMSTQWLSYGLHSYQAELYPTRIRARGVGFVYSWSRLSGILTPFFIAFFLREFGVPGVFAFVALCMAVVIIAVAGLGPRTRRLEVEAIAH
jgi:MFS transporter, putative metabolite:H+ symporter